MGIRTTAKLLAVSAVAISGATIINTGSASATVSKGSVEISPVCADRVSGVAVWQAFNKNDVKVNVNWKNLDTQVNGSYAAPAGTSTFTTNYSQNEKNEINNTTNFVMPEASDDVTRNATNDVCTPEQLPVVCMNAADVTSADVQAHFIDRYHAAVKYIGAKPLCDGEKVQINFSGYLILNPDYNGGYLENNPTATPQFIYANHTNFLTSQQTELELYLYDELVTVDGVPIGEIVKNLEQCFNIQNDVYRGDIILGFDDTIGHGEWNLKSEIYPAHFDATCKGAEEPDHGNEGGNGGNEQPTAPVQPGQGAEVQVVETAAPVAAVQPTVLADTGERTMLPAILAAILAVSAALVAVPLRRFKTNA